MRTLVAPLLALAITTGTLTAVAQTKSKSSSRSSATTEAKEKSKYHRLPSHYGQLGLKEDQVVEIYEIKDSYGPKIDELKAELASLQEEMAEEIEDVLTTTQKGALSKLKNSTSSKTVSSSRSKSGTSKKSSTSRRSSSKKD